MHIHRCMGSRTISLEDGAYEKLKASKRPGESFSDVVHRLLGPRQPSLLDLHGLLDEDGARELAATVERMRREDVEAQRDPVGA